MGAAHSAQAGAEQPASFATPAARAGPFACDHIASPADLETPTEELQAPPSPADSTEEEEAESFEGWRSTPASSGRGSLEAPLAPMSSQQLAPGSASGSGSASQDAPSSSGWLGQRPSADTPLPDGSSSEQKPSGGAPATFQPPAGRISAQFIARHSASDDSTVSVPGSARSSFALERASAETNRASLDAFRQVFRASIAGDGAGATALPNQAYAALETSQGSGATLELVLSMADLPPGLHDHFTALCVLPPQTPVPVTTLGLLWQADASEVAAVLGVLAGKGILNLARLATGQIWALPQAQQLQLLHAACKDPAPYHARLVDGYLAAVSSSTSAGQDGARPAADLRDVPDDGYFLANVGHHLVGARRLHQVKALLLDPAWLEKKVAVCGIGAVVADFRRYLLARAEKDVKLVLEALQMSIGSATAHPDVPGLLRCMLASRLMTVTLSPAMQAWLADQQTAVYADGAAAAARGLPRCLPPLTPSLDQAGGLQRLALKGHRGAITRVMLTPSGTDAITASADGTARLWDLEIGDCVLTMDGHTAPITAMAITADGSLLVTASEDGTARAFELEKGLCLRVLPGHSGGVAALLVDPFGRFVVTGGDDGFVRVWDLTTAKVQYSLPVQPAVCCMALSPCNRFAVVGCVTGAAHMLDVSRGQLVGTLEGHTSTVWCVEVSPDGKHAVTASHDGTARVWSLKTGRCKHVLAGHTRRINALALSPDGRTAATASDDCTARVWDVRSGACKRVLQGHRAWVSHVAISPGGDRLVTTSGDSTAIAWSLDTGEMLRVLEGHTGAVTAAAITRRARFVVTGSEGGSLRVWDLCATAATTPKWHEGRIRALAARDGLVVATAGDDCLARLWDSSLGEYKGLLKGHTTPIRWAYFSEDGQRLVTASPDRCVMVWDCASGECIRQLPEHKGSRMKSFAASGDLSRAVVCLFDSTVTVWDLDAGQPAVALQRWGDRSEDRGHTSAVNEVMMTADGATVVTLSKDTTARIWDAASGTCRHVLRGHTDAVQGGCLSEQGSLVATYSFDGTLRLWSLEGGPCLATIQLKFGVQRMALSPCGWQIAVALADGNVRLIDVDKLDAPQCLVQHPGEVTGLSFSADGSQLATSGTDGTARLWAVGGGALQGVFVSDNELTTCHYDSISSCIVLGTDRGVVHFVDAAQRGAQPT